MLSVSNTCVHCIPTTTLEGRRYHHLHSADEETEAYPVEVTSLSSHSWLADRPGSNPSQVTPGLILTVAHIPTRESASPWGSRGSPLLSLPRAAYGLRHFLAWFHPEKFTIIKSGEKFSKCFRYVMTLHSISFFLRWEKEKDRFPYGLGGQGFSLPVSWDFLLRFQGYKSAHIKDAEKLGGPKGSQPQPKPLMHTSRSSVTYFKYTFECWLCF